MLLQRGRSPCALSLRGYTVPHRPHPPPLPLSPSHPRFLSISKKLNTLWLTLSRAATELLAFLFGYVHWDWRLHLASATLAGL
jgi:hypothetical protein